MTPELAYLLAVTVLTSLLWMPHSLGAIKLFGLPKPADFAKPRDSKELPNWIQRGNRAHLNALENLPVFATLILIAHTLNISTETTVVAAAVYFWARLAHALIHISGFKYFMARPMAFMISWLAMIAIAVEIFRAV